MELLRVSQAAKLVGLTRQAMYKAVQEGRIDSHEIAGIQLISRQDILTYKVDETMQERGRKPKNAK